ncbi:LOW QUALITY PROTEIN: uncharacterized protein LOC108024299 [Drosophila biarmipes]|uniref:LOW QUALITY PROTEIN: uncharacterized protein LOC108024299 n=1 Tax=Drosophila biarmipes TaxID=125945 RepID=UPI0007E6EC1A|nr:LOW QUALITY PROTEIN: uncharacterized protein LOC108024299 [Drosophila biarmipes]
MSSCQSFAQFRGSGHTMRVRHDVHRCEGCRGRAAATCTSTSGHKRLMPREKRRPPRHRSAPWGDGGGAA